MQENLIINLIINIEFILGISVQNSDILRELLIDTKVKNKKIKKVLKKC